jgi:hypothetical protein
MDEGTEEDRHELPVDLPQSSDFPDDEGIEGR